jgi:uncharacterized protein (TIGR04255 family)
MNTLRALGRWPNAPLAYLIAEIRYQRINDYETVVPTLVERLADDYPIEETHAFEANAEMMQSGAVPQLEPLRDLRNFKSTMGLRIGRTGLSLHCTDYAGWEDGFRDQLFKVLEAVSATLRPRVLLRSSLHCVDLLVPRADEQPDSYLVEGLRPWATELEPNGAFDQGNNVTRFTSGNIATTLLILSRVKAQVVLTPTLNAMPLAFSQIQTKALTFFRETGGAFAIMDIDVAQETARPFQIEAIKAEYEEIHKRASAVFLAATTPEAQQLWQTK